MCEQTRQERLTPLPIVLALLLSAGLLTHCTRVATRAPEDATADDSAFSLPAIPMVFAGWVAAGDLQHFAADDLYLYINGGAVTWIECGFRQMRAREYANDEEDRLMLEIYEMADPVAARCIYQRRTGGGGESLELGDGGRLFDYYLEFHRGRFLVTLTSLESASGPPAGMTDFAAAVESLLRSGSNG